MFDIFITIQRIPEKLSCFGQDCIAANIAFVLVCIYMFEKA